MYQVLDSFKGDRHDITMGLKLSYLIEGKMFRQLLIIFVDSPIIILKVLSSEF